MADNNVCCIGPSSSWSLCLQVYALVTGGSRVRACCTVASHSEPLNYLKNKGFFNFISINIMVSQLEPDLYKIVSIVNALSQQTQHL